MAAKKGGGLKQNLVWIAIIGGLALLAYVTLGGGNTGNSTSNKAKTGNVAAVSTPKDASGASTGGGSSQNVGTSSKSSFNLSPKNGGNLGGSYLLKNLSMSKGSGYESANIFLKAVSGAGGVPKYGASISGSTIVVTLADTKNYDIDAGRSSYSGNNPLAVNGSVIKSIAWAQNGEDSLRININLKKQASFDDIVLSNPLAIEIRVAI